MNEQLLARAPADPVDVDAMPEETSGRHDEPWQLTWPDGTTRRLLGVDPKTGGRTFLLYLPSGYGRPEEAEHLVDNPLGRFESHSCREEIFNLGGQYRFGDWYDFPEMGYLNHPPGWVHPADQSTTTGVLLLIKNSCPVDFAFHRIPDGWDGVEGVLDAFGNVRADWSSTSGVTMLDTFALEWQPATAADGTVLGFQTKELWRDDQTGWITTMMRAPAGWQNPLPVSKVAVDEMFILQGDLRHSRHGNLHARSYYCDPDGGVQGGECSRAGFLAIRWNRSQAMRDPALSTD